MNALIENCGHELVNAPYIQTVEQMRAGIPNIGKITDCAEELLLDGASLEGKAFEHFRS